MSPPEKLSSLVARGSAFLRPPNAGTGTGMGSIQANRALVAVLAVAVLAGVVPVVVARTVSDYRRWLAIEAGGLPYNFLGYLGNVLMRPLARSDLRAPAPYDPARLRDLYGPEAFRSYFFSPAGEDREEGAEDGDGDGDGEWEKRWEKKKIPRRAGPRPDVPAFTAPQRQTSQFAPGHPAGGGGIPARQRAFLAALAAANPGLVRLAPSAAEGGYHDALWLATTTAAAAAAAAAAGDHHGDDKQEPRKRPIMGRLLRGEFAHPHGEGSAHALVSLADAAALIEGGWAERHPLSGGRLGLLPWGFVFLYAPRDAAELAVWKRVILASARYVAAAAAAAADVAEVVEPEQEEGEEGEEEEE